MNYETHATAATARIDNTQELMARRLGKIVALCISIVGTLTIAIGCISALV